MLNIVKGLTNVVIYIYIFTYKDLYPHDHAFSPHSRDQFGYTGAHLESSGLVLKFSTRACIYHSLAYKSPFLFKNIFLTHNSMPLKGKFIYSMPYMSENSTVWQFYICFGTRVIFIDSHSILLAISFYILRNKYHTIFFFVLWTK